MIRVVRSILVPRARLPSRFFLQIKPSGSGDENARDPNRELSLRVVLGVRLPKMSRATAHTVSTVVVPMVPAGAV